MKTALAIRHLHFEDLGILENLLFVRDYRVRYWDIAIEPTPPVPVNEVDLLIVLGGPIGANDVDRYPFLATELDLLRQRLARRRPTLGICLGAQLIARALGAAVAPMGHKEIGFAPLHPSAGEDALLAPLGDIPVLHWHGDQFDLPPGASLLAASAACPHQIYRIDAYLLALQCHLEVDPTRLEAWLVGHAGELEAVGIHPETLRNEAHHYGARLAGAARKVFGIWLDGLPSAQGEPA